MTYRNQKSQIMTQKKPKNIMTHRSTDPKSNMAGKWPKRPKRYEMDHIPEKADRDLVASITKVPLKEVHIDGYYVHMDNPGLSYKQVAEMYRHGYEVWQLCVGQVTWVLRP